MMVLSLLLLITLFSQGETVIPKPCAGNITAVGGSGVCCPIPKGSQYPCGGRGIGTCQLQYVQFERLPEYLQSDDRMDWPSRFFRYLCKCEGNYFGVACEECWFGWEGPLCNKRTKVVRRNILSFSEEEKKKFVDIVSKMPYVPTNYLILYEKYPIYSDPLWRPKFIEADLQYLLAYLHRYASRATLFHSKQGCERYENLNNNHNVVGFATWHRYMMLFWEKELRKIATRLYGWYDFAIPYWDWVDSDKCDVCTNNLLGAPGPWVNGKQLIHPASPFSHWIEYCTPPDSDTHCFGCHASWPRFGPLHRSYVSNEFPTTRDLQFTLSRKSFYLPQKEEDMGKCRGLHQALEGFCGPPGENSTFGYMHNKVHNMVRGSFCCASTAANDPLFIPHHSQIDRILQIWFERYHPRTTEYPNHGVHPGNCRECNMIGFIPPVRHIQMFIDLRDLGIYYDNYRFGRSGFDGNMFIKYGPAYYVV